MFFGYVIMWKSMSKEQSIWNLIVVVPFMLSLYFSFEFDSGIIWKTYSPKSIYVKLELLIIRLCAMIMFWYLIIGLDAFICFNLLLLSVLLRSRRMNVRASPLN